jgi:serine/threonine protein phosphatase 1
MRIAVIPDIHGHIRQLKALLRAIGPAGQGRTVVQLGDLVDRGPESRACVELVMALQRQSPGHFVALKGNHERMLAEAAKGGPALAAWLKDGGDATLRSYGADFERLCRGSGEHGAWMEALPQAWEHEGLLFCHAGLGPKNADASDKEAMLWQRPPLVKGRFKAVICGHTPTSSGRVEVEDGVFRCDLGLAKDPGKPLEYLELRVEKGAFSWEIAPAGR